MMKVMEFLIFSDLGYLLLGGLVGTSIVLLIWLISDENRKERETKELNKNQNVNI